MVDIWLWISAQAAVASPVCATTNSAKAADAMSMSLKLSRAMVQRDLLQLTQEWRCPPENGRITISFQEALQLERNYQGTQF